MTLLHNRLNIGKLPFAIPFFVIFAVLIFIYSDTFSYPFHFDDDSAIVNNESIRDISDIESIWSRNPARFIPFFSFAVNYYFDGLNVFGYHLFNFVVHFLTAMAAYWLAAILMSTRYGGASFHAPEKISGKTLWLFPLIVALLFASHPLQTQAVTYIWQRNTSMAALFYLLSIALYIKSSLLNEEKTDEAESLSKFYLAGSALVAVAAMFTKQTCVTLPVAIVLAEFFFISGFISRLKEKAMRLFIFLPPMMIVPMLTAFGKNNELNHIGARADNILSVPEYLLTQFNVIVTYLKLLVFPVNQNLDYDFPVAHSFADSWISFTGLLALLLLAFYLFNKNRLASFGIIFFFLTLSVESSIFPLEDLVFEHRMYLPSFGLFIAFTVVLFNAALRLARPKAFNIIVVFMVISTGSLALAAKNRNKVWENDLILWKDVAKKSPGKARGLLNLGVAYLRLNNENEAKKWFEQALVVAPQSGFALYNLSLIYDKNGDTEKAITLLNKILKADPAVASAHYALANIYMRDKAYSKAAHHYNSGLKLEAGDNTQALLALGTAFMHIGQIDKSIKVYETVLKREPDNKTAQGNLVALRQYKKKR
ncbi:hypothetical protein MNBD_NITROSPINAE04-452 [hydrothermal vent metagenome]|uniref:Tetratricopeptide repeat protein 21A/21B C-terminal ARM domain-containing protein n=1 Tax=hydrothermal vent metagenome TaxID=652676 RepID=A0A3B1C2G5_9ZZZZ